MASSTSLEDHITCSVCFEIYRDPHALKCLHTFCLTCIKQIQRGSTILCPECREPSHINDVKDDFKIQGFIDLFNSQKSAKKELSGRELYRQVSEELSSGKIENIATCQVCNEPEKTIKSKCVECDQFMCQSCAETHTGISTCHHHQVIPIQDVISAIQADLKKTIAKLQQEKTSIGARSKEISNEVDFIDESRQNQVDEVNRFTDDLIKDLDDNRNNLNRLINSACQNYTKGLTLKKQVYDDSQKDIQDKIDLMAQLVISEDISTLTDTARTVEKSIKKDVKLMKEKLPKYETGQRKSPVSIQKGNKVDPHKVISVRIGIESKSKMSDSPTKQLTGPQYSDLLKSSFNWERCVGISFYPTRIRFIEDNVWVTGLDGVFIFNKNCQIIKTIQHPLLKMVRGLVKVHTGDVIVSCVDNNGIIRLDSKGQFIEKIASGSFADICSHKDELFALNNQTKKILVFKSKPNKSWTAVKEFNNVEASDRISVNSDTLYVSSSEFHKICVYSLEGRLLYNTGEHGEGGRAGKLNYPFLCGVNSGGDLLVSDYANHRLQVRYHRGGQWHIVILPGDLLCPIDAAVDGHIQSLWVIKQNPCQLLKFSPKQQRSTRRVNTSV